MNVTNRRLLEVVGMLMIGDGALAVARPRTHCRLWHGAGGWWDTLVNWFVQHPDAVRGLGVAEIAAGCCLAVRQEDRRAAGREA